MHDPTDYYAQCARDAADAAELRDVARDWMDIFGNGAGYGMPAVLSEAIRRRGDELLEEAASDG